MGDSERPEVARPEQNEVNIAAAFSPIPQSRPAYIIAGCVKDLCKVQDRCMKFYSLPSETLCTPGLGPSPQPGLVFASARGRAVPEVG